MTILDTLTDLLNVEAQLKALGARKTKLRDSLDAEARARWEADGAVPSWKVARLGSATLAGTDSTVVDVVDEDAYAAWAREDRPESVAFELAIPATIVDDHAEALAALKGIRGVSSSWRVHPGVLAGIVAYGRPDVETGRLIAQDGQIVPGVAVRAKEPYLVVRLDPQAKNRALAEMVTQPDPESVSVSPAVAS